MFKRLVRRLLGRTNSTQEQHRLGGKSTDPDRKRWSSRLRGLGLGAVALALIVPAGGFVWGHGLGDAVCSGDVPGICTSVPETECVATFEQVVRQLDGGDSMKDVYAAHFTPATDRSVQDDLDWFNDHFAMIEHIAMDGLATVVPGTGTDCTGRVEVFTTTTLFKHLANRNYTWHQDKHDVYQLTLHLQEQLTNRTKSAVSTLPGWTRIEKLGPTTAPVFEFTRRGYYYKDGDRRPKSGRLYKHQGGARHARLTAICAWAPNWARDAKTGRIFDWSEASLRTYAGWVSMQEARWVEGSWPSTCLQPRLTSPLG